MSKEQVKNLVELKMNALEYCAKRAAKGGKVASYNCPECQAELVAGLPDDEKERWTSATICYECGALHSTVKTVHGVTAYSAKDTIGS